MGLPRAGVPSKRALGLEMAFISNSDEILKFLTVNSALLNFSYHETIKVCYFHHIMLFTALTKTLKLIEPQDIIDQPKES